MEPVREDEEEKSWRQSEFKRERKIGRDVIVAIDHGPNSKLAFDWALLHFCRDADTLYIVHAVSSTQNQIVYDMSQDLMAKLAVEAFQISKVKTVPRIVEGDPGKVICKEVNKLKPAALIMGTTRGRSWFQRFFLFVYFSI
ncbi:hypothetical protein GIB67_005525 [Kingdonia uniflora]|uniref:UspA domain-containing protein n=1 Tax=Kingdonia uniflora TaxID=39325 RepID=A0A7J7NHW2_9MAGN|nr:hypothetical protein GIB67_005525 [Kingdonia uniflora]